MPRFWERKKTTDLRKDIEERARMKEELRQAEETGKARAAQEGKRTREQIKTGKSTGSSVGSAWGGFQNYATKFANNQNNKPVSVFGNMDIGLGATKEKKQKRNKTKNVWGY